MDENGHEEADKASSDDEGGLLDTMANESDVDSNQTSDAEEEEDESVSDDKQGYLDIEASESDDSASFISVEVTDSYSSTDEEPRTFPQFVQLPVELRQQIWEAFCPDLIEPTLILRFNFFPGVYRHVWDCHMLEDQTDEARAVLSVHHESRTLALRRFPDELDVYPGRHDLDHPWRVFRYHRDRDLILVSNSAVGQRDPDSFDDMIEELCTFPRDIKHLAIETLYTLTDEISLMFPDLECLYYVVDGSELPFSLLEWCLTESAHRYQLSFSEEDEYRVLRDYSVWYSWPKVSGPQRIDDRAIVELMTHIVALESSDYPVILPDLAGNTPFALWPLIQFGNSARPRSFDEVMADLEADDEGDTDEDENDSSESEPNEYEDSGIDDEEFDEDGSDSDEDDLVVQPLSDEPSAFQGFSPIQEGASDHEEDDERGLSMNHSSQVSAPADDASDSDGAPVQVTRQPKRRIVSSDSEDEEDDEISQPRKRVRTVARQRPLSDSESEDDQGGAKLRENVQGNGGRSDLESETNVHSEEDDDDEEEYDEEEEDEEDEEEPTAKPMSLMERLQAHRNENPDPTSDMDGEDGEVEDEDREGGGYDNREYLGDLQDDEDEDGNGVSGEEELDGGDDDASDDEDTW